MSILVFLSTQLQQVNNPPQSTGGQIETKTRALTGVTVIFLARDNCKLQLQDLGLCSTAPLLARIHFQHKRSERTILFDGISESLSGEDSGLFKAAVT